MHCLGRAILSYHIQETTSVISQLTAMHFHFHFILHILHYYGRHVTNCDNVFMLFYEFQQSAN
jgi:hypothetical protein